MHRSNLRTALVAAVVAAAASVVGGLALHRALDDTPAPDGRFVLDEPGIYQEPVEGENVDLTGRGVPRFELLDIDDQLSFRRPGIGTDVTRKLRKGHWSIQRQLDLHGLRSDEARAQLSAFVRQARLHGIRCVRVVHGKGLGSPGKAPVLKRKVFAWLVQKNEVLAFVQARPAEGGAGALVVLLQPAPAR